MYSVLNCHNVGKHCVLPRIIVVQWTSIGNVADVPPVASFLTRVLPRIVVVQWTSIGNVADVPPVVSFLTRVLPRIVVVQ
jgi:hypothetical protein